MPRDERFRVRRRHLLLQVGAAGVLSSLPLARATALRRFPERQVWRYAVSEEGREAGEHAISFLPGKQAYLVRSDSRYVARSPEDPRPREFRLRAEETWRDGWLQALRSDSSYGDQSWSVEAVRDGDRMVIDSNARRRIVSGFLVPGTLWPIDTPYERALLDPVEGRMKYVEGHALGHRFLEGFGETRHFLLTGEFPRKLWYGLDGVLAKVSLPSGPLSEVTFRLL